MKLREYNFEKYQNEREEIVELILQGKMLPDENGIILLPERLKNEEMARGGYVYLTENIFNIDSGRNIILQSEYLENWYFCGTF